MISAELIRSGIVGSFVAQETEANAKARAAAKMG